MRFISKKIQELLSGLKLRRQLNIIYLVGLIIPMVCIGVFLVFNTSNLLTNYYQDLNEANNYRVKTILSEITTQIYTLSENIASDDDLQSLLSKKYKSKRDFLDSALSYEELGDYLASNTEIKDIKVYSDNPTIYKYEHIENVDEKIKAEYWYQKAISQESVFWTSMKDKDEYGSVYYNLCLVRQIKLLDGKSKAALIIKVDENFLKNQVNTSDYELLVYIENGGIFFCSNRLWYDLSDTIYINYKDNYYNYKDQIFIEDKKYLITVSTLGLYNTDDRIYVCNLDNSAYNNIYQILSLCLLIVIASTVIPFILIRYFTVSFTVRVDTLREAMHKASNENYDVPAKLMGEDEISQAFTDLQKMVSKIKDKDAKMYEERINTQRIQNAQQRIEMDVLASQINPHFLYNTLETIRMKAFKAGDKDVATAIKLLGKSMRYVLENTGTSSTALKNELVYIETYLQIQKLRFTDRINYSIVIEEGINTEEIDILPLLIQPIVENAIIHGLEDAQDEGRILIEVSSDNKENLHIEVSDNGSGMNAEDLNALRTKINTPHLNTSRNIGLHNINQRIRLCYGSEYGLEIESIENKGTKVSIIMPLKINRDVI